MKIKTVNDPAYQIFSRVNEKQEKDQFSDTLNREQNKKQKKQDEALEVTDEKVGQAIEGFAQDSQTKEKGISASQVGSGPGLKVVLKDGSGAVIRELSGEEFLKLREVAAMANRGKILDQKL